MKRTRILLPSLVVLLALGVLAGVGLAAPRTVSLQATDTTAATTTDTTTTDTTTTGTTATTTTAATTTTDTTPTTTTATTPTTTLGQTTTQGATPPPAPPTAPCDTTQITCGNNASTQVAIVSQTCAAVQQNSVLTIDVQTLDGKPVTGFTINNNTTCLNTLSITQVVQQFCVGCTIVIIPPPPVQNTIIQTVIVQAPPPAPQRAGYCMPYPVKRGDGTYSTLVMLDVGQPDWDPAYALAVKANFDPANGYSCPTPIDLPRIPTFTLTVPLSFIGQKLRLCLQPADPKAQPFCHDVQIDNGATVTVPVTQNMAATVVPQTAAPAKSAKTIKAATGAYTSLLGKQKHAKTTKKTTKRRSSHK